MTKFGFNNPDRPHATLCSSFCNLLNLLIGSGVLTLPFVFSVCGIPISIVLLIFAWFVCLIPSIALVMLSSWLKAESYDGLCDLLVPRIWWFMDLIILYGLFGVLSMYIIVASDGLTLIFPNSTRFSRGILVVCIGFFISLPRNLNSARFTSILSMIFMFILWLSVLSLGLFPEGSLVSSDSLSPVSPHPNPSSPSQILTTCIFAFCSQINLPRMNMELCSKFRHRFPILILSSSLLALCFYISFGISGMLIFSKRGLVSSDLLLSLPINSKLFSFVRIGLVFVNISKLPLTIHPARLILKTHGTRFFCSSFSVICPSWVLTFLILIFAFLCFLILDSLVSAISLFTSITSVCCVFIFPGAFLWFSLSNSTTTSPSTSPLLLVHERKPWNSKFRKITSIFLLITGCVIGLITIPGNLSFR